MAEQYTVEGWAIVEMMGNRTVSGYVRTRYLGLVAMLNIFQPEADPVERVLVVPERINSGYFTAGTKIKISRVKSDIFIPTTSIYQMTMCSEAEAIAKIPVTVEVLAHLRTNARVPSAAAARAAKGVQ